MNEVDFDAGRFRVMERHAQSILVVIVVALLVWVGQTTQATAVKVATLEARIGALQAQMTEPDRSLTLLIEQNGELRRRILELERKVYQAE